MSLRNKTILVTRPADQSANLCRLIEAAEGKSIAYPTMAIEPIKPSFLPNIKHYDYVIFISANAVQHAANFIPLEKSNRTACVGYRTKTALEQFDIDVNLVPESQFNSEGLLALDELSEINNKNILIVRGVGGKAMLKQQLEHRGAIVDYFECYRRRIPEIDYQPLRYAFLNNNIDVVTSSSSQSLMNLIQICPDAVSVPLISISEDMAKKARDWGYIGKIIQAENATDEAIIYALSNFYRDE